MNLPIDQYPTEGSSNENVLFATLGSFWTQVFKDQAVLHGLTIAQAEEIFQDYYRLLESINSYSANQIDVFNKIKWFPLMIKKSELNSNVLLFGEEVDNAEVTFNTPNYVFGSPMPEESNVYVAPLPDNLKELSIITNRVISPTFVLVNNMDVKIAYNRLYFYGNPFNLPNISTFNLLNSAGQQTYYKDPVTGQSIPDAMLVLWVYNGKIDTNALKYNLAYLFGINLQSSQQSKGILEATIKLFSTGPNIYQLKALCCAFLGVKPIIEEQETIQNIITTDTDRIITTDKHVYRYDRYYTLGSDIQVGSKLSIGDVPVDAVEYYDNLTYKNWWINKIVPKISVDTNSAIRSPSMIIPASMFVGNYKYGLIFDNTFELATRDSNGDITFPVNGDPNDVAIFQAQINQESDRVAAALGGLPKNSALLINPLDFLFNAFFCNNAAMIKVNFKNKEQLIFFTQYFSIIKGCLPKHVFFTFFFDVPIPEDIYDGALDEFTGHTGILPSLQISKQLDDQNFIINLNSNAAGPSNNAYIKHNLLIRHVPTIYYGTTANWIVTASWVVTNYTGTTSYSGYTTYSGYTGETGTSGYTMYTGYTSYTGYTTYQGMTGYTSYSGYTSYAPYTGYTGWAGTTAHPGPTASVITNRDYNFLEVMQSP